MNTPSGRSAVRRLRLGLAGAVLTAVTAGLLPASAALAGPATQPAASQSAPVTGKAPIPGVRAACPAARPGQAQCLALVRTNVKSQAAAIAAGAAPAGYGPADLQNAYNLPSATAGAGQTVAIVNAYDDPNAAADLAAYRAQYGLPACTQASGCFRKVSQDGTSTYPVADESWAWSTATGMDMVSAICPNCRILLVEAKSASLDDLGAAVNEAVALGAKYVSTSYNAPEGATGTFPGQLARDDALYFNHPGVAITASDYDASFPSPQPNSGVGYPASSPDVIAVGGTTLTRDASAARGWTEAGYEALRGYGCSASEPKPAWQKDTFCTTRTVADVSAVDDPATGVAIYDTYTLGGNPGWYVAGGGASPIIAAVYALAGTPSTAASPASYPYADPSALNDITIGSSGTGCPSGTLTCEGPGYDGPTGLGTPNGVAAFSYGVHGSHGDLAGTVTDAATGKPVAGAQVTAGGYTAVTGPDGRYDLAAVPGTTNVTASGFGYAAKTLTGVTVTAGKSQAEDFALAAVPMQAVTGTVTDGSGQHWPLYAQVSVPGTPARAYTDPATGKYTLNLPAGTYTIHADPVSPGYQPADQQITVGTAAVTQDLTVPIDEQAGCTAPGYQPASVLAEDFSGASGTTPPTGWNVVTHSRPSTNTWYFGSSVQGFSNLTGTSGNFAMGIEGPPGTIDTALVSPVMNMTGDPYPQLTFNQWTPTEIRGAKTVDVSTDGGQTWTTVWKIGRGTGIFSEPPVVAVPLPQAAGMPSVQLRFHLVDPILGIDDTSWQISHIAVSDCAPASGGLLVGSVRDANTGQGVAGATVTGAGQAGASGTSIQVPGDPADGDGFYELFSGTTGTPQITATANGYAAASAAPKVTAGQVTVADFTLKAGRVAVSAGPVTATEALGGKAATATVMVRNTGTAPVTVHVDTRPGGFAGSTSAGSGKAAASVPVLRVRGRFSPRPGRLPALAAPAVRPRASTAAGPSWSDATGWSPIADLPSGVAANAGAVDPVTGKVYSVGGTYDNTGLRYTAAVTMYDPATRQWSQLPPMRYARFAPQAAVLGGKLYVTGGTNSGAPEAALEIYDPASGTWSQGAPIPRAYTDAATVALNGKMYVIGGCGTLDCGQADVQVYNPRTDQWTAAADYPLPIAWTSCGAIAGKIYCAGGVGDSYASATRAGYVYDPRANAWTPIAAMPAGMWGSGYGAADGKLLISGGITADGDVLTNQGYAYDPGTNTWSALPNAPIASYEGGSACGFYQFGGWSYFTTAFGEDGSTGIAAQLPGFGGCGGQDWLTATPQAVTLAPGQATSLKVTLAATTPAVTQPGTYTAALRIGGDDPYTAPAIPVTLTVTPPKTWGQLAGTITGSTCAGGTQPLPGATVQVTGGGFTATLTTDPQGKYSTWVDATRSPFTVIVSQPGWQTQGGQVQVKAQAVTTQDYTLNQSCG